MSTNVGELNVHLGMNTNGLSNAAREAIVEMAQLDEAVAKMKKQLEFDQATSNLKLLKAAVPSMSSMGSQAHTAAYSDSMIEGLSRHVRLEDEAARNRRLALQEEGAALRLQLMTETEKRELRRQSDMEHLQALREANAISAREFGQLSQRAGTLGLGNTALDNNRNNRGFQGAMIAQQLGFGLQDFMSQVQNSKNAVDGLGRGVMAVSNNVQMLGAAWGPMGLAVTAIGGALAGIIIPASIKWLTNTEAIDKAHQSILDKMGHMAERQAEIIRLKNQEGSSVIDAVKHAREEALIQDEVSKSESARTAGMRTRKKELEGLIEADKKRLEEIEKNHAGGELGPSGDPRFQEIDKRLNERQNELADIKKDLDPADARIVDADKRAADARAKAAALDPLADQAREMQSQKEIADFKREEDADAVLRNRDQLAEKKQALGEEMDLIQKKLNDDNTLNKEYLQLQMKDKVDQYTHVATVLAAIDPYAEQKKQERDDLDRKEKEAKAFEAATEAADKFKLDSLEKFGTDRQKLLAKQARETKELDLATNSDADSMATLASQHEAERKQLEIRDQEAKIAALGNQSKLGGGGVDIASSAGVQAINRYIAGKNPVDIEMEQLDVLKQQLELMQDNAAGRGDRAMKFTGPDAQLGAEDDAFTAEYSRKDKAADDYWKWSREHPEAWGKSFDLNLKNEDSGTKFRDRMGSVLQQSRERSAERGSAFMEKFNQVIKDSRDAQEKSREEFRDRMARERTEALKKLAGKPPYQVVNLSN